MSKYWLVFGLLFLFLLPSTVFASGGIYKIYDVDPISGEIAPDSFQYAHYEGLVPCGKEINISSNIDVNGDPIGFIQMVEIPCQFCHLFVMLNRLIHFTLSELVPLLSIGMLVIAGIMFFFAQGNTGRLSKARQLFTGVVLGLAIIYGAWLIISGLLSLVGATEWTGLQGTWFKFDCPVHYPEDYIAPTPTDPIIEYPDGHWEPQDIGEVNTPFTGEEVSKTFFSGQLSFNKAPSPCSSPGDVVVAVRCFPGTWVLSTNPLVPHYITEGCDKTSNEYGFFDNNDGKWKCNFFKDCSGFSVSGRIFRYCAPEEPPTP